MNTDQMAYLIDIAKTGSINTTAKRLFSSQQAISESIKRLENELNCVLLLRSKKGVALTEDGKYVLQQVSNMYEQYEELQKYLAGFKMIYDNLKSILKNYGVEEINRVGEVFDPNLEQALLTECQEDKDDDVVLEVLLKGYKLKDRVIRPASVKINQK